MRLINEIFLLLYLIYKRLNILQQVKKMFKKLGFIFEIIFVFYGKAFILVTFITSVIAAAGLISDWLTALIIFGSGFAFIINLVRGV